MKKIVLLLFSLLLLISCGGDDDKISINSGEKGTKISRNSYILNGNRFSIYTQAISSGFLSGHKYNFNVSMDLCPEQAYNTHGIVGRTVSIYIIQSNRTPFNVYSGKIPTGSWNYNGSFYSITIPNCEFTIPCNLLTKKGYNWDMHFNAYTHISGYPDPINDYAGKYNGYKIFFIVKNTPPNPYLTYNNAEITRNQIIDLGTVNSSQTLEFTLSNKGGHGLNLLGNPAVSVTGASDITVSQQPAITNIPCKEEGGKTTFNLQINPSGDTLKTATVNIPLGLTGTIPDTFQIKYRTGELPTATITAPAANSIVKNSITVTGTAADATSGVQKVEYKIGDGSWQTATGTTSWSFIINPRLYSDGQYTIYVRAIDNADNPSDIKTITLTIENSQKSLEASSSCNEFGAIWEPMYGPAFLVADPTKRNNLYFHNEVENPLRIDTGDYTGSINRVAVDNSRHHLLSFHGQYLNYFQATPFAVTKTIKGIVSTSEYAACAYNGVAYIAYAKTANTLFLANTTSGTWNSIQIKTHNSGKIEAISIVNKDASYVWVSYIHRINAYTGTLYVLKINLPSNQVTTYNRGSRYLEGTPGIKPKTAIVLDDAGKPYIISPDEWDDYDNIGCYYFNGNSWVPNKSMNLEGVHAIDAIYHNGILHISAIDQNNNLVYIKKTGSGWSSLWTKVLTVATVEKTATKIAMVNSKIEIAASVNGKIKIFRLH